MTGTGNDIVSLNAVNARATQPRYYSKILSTSEIVLYNEPGFTNLAFENFVWLLWSVKESAYKYFKRIKSDLIFSPTKFIVQHLQMPAEYNIANVEVREMEGRGFDRKNNIVFNSTIKIGSETFYSSSIIHREFIASVVNGDGNFENTYWGIKLINKSDPLYQSFAVREFLIKRLKRLFHLDNPVISKTPEGFPVVQDGINEREVPVSLSHHDCLVAYSFQSGDFQSRDVAIKCF